MYHDGHPHHVGSVHAIRETNVRHRLVAILYGHGTPLSKKRQAEVER